MSVGKKIFVLLCGWLSILMPAYAEEYIQHFESDIYVEDDGTLQVEENIIVQHEGVNIRHGIVRGLADSKGERYHIMQVLRNGVEETWSLQQSNGQQNLYIGKEYEILGAGVSSYQITYKVYDALRSVWNKPYIELYWNVTGQWNFPIAETMVHVHYPQGTKVLSSYRYQTSQQPLNSENFVFGYLPAGEEITIAQIFEKGTVKVRLPMVWQGLLLGLGGMFVFYLLAWLIWGKDPAPRAIVPDWETPKNISALEAAFIHHNGNAPKNSFFIHILWLVYQKAVSIREIQKGKFAKAKGFEINPQAGYVPKQAEEVLFFKYFPKGMTIYDSEPDEQIARYVDKLKQKVSAQLEGKAYHKRKLLTLCGALILPIVWGILFPQQIGLLFFLSVMMFILSATRNFMVCIIIGFNLLPILISMSGQAVPLLVMMLPYVTLVMIFKYLLFQPTVPGQRQKEKILGLNMFLKAITAHNHPVKHPLMTPQGQDLSMEKRLTPEDMEALFPYAVALGLEKQWEKKFVTIFGEQAWQKLTAVYGYYQGDFVNRLNYCTQHAAVYPVKVSAPYSSGRGGFGGGFAGGGFGGGRSGGW